ncbi:transcriptional regulator PpsR [Mesorhizobium loti]|uniref:Transcriptional regulator PpsR n=1 Tax=Mesorhizobium loti R88b TaxID=935548 RepID=A0A6M7WT84_RHILI|nr:transcriptional regulator PpsR [Mesorhizobium loti]QKD05277.1 transcriptional regulator PpsR [Mesorhizobium loti R88b]
MDKQVSREVSRSFRSNDELFAGLGADALAALATANSDVTLVLARSGHILDVSYRDGGLKTWDVDGWVGKLWQDTVTVESRDKIRDLLQEAATASPTRSRQVNHPGKTGSDLPVGYRIVSFSSWPHKVALGTDLRAMADMQQRLVRAQIEMEKDYRKLRDIESRYRILFHLAVEPLIVVEAQTLKILDANEDAAKLFGKPVKKLVGSSAASVFAKADQGAAIESLTALGARARADVFRARPATLDRYMQIRVTPFREFGKTNLLVCFASEEPARANSSSASDANMVSVVDSLPEGIVIVNAEGKIVEANPAFLDLIRVVTLDRIEDKSLDKWLGGSSVDLQVLMANLREHGTVRRFSSVVRDELGGTESVDVSAARIAGREGPLFGFVIREAARTETIQPGGVTDRQGSATQFTDLVGRVPLKDLVRDTADIIEKLCIEAALRLTDNNRASAADMLGLSRQSLYIKLKRYGISDVEEDED